MYVLDTINYIYFILRHIYKHAEQACVKRSHFNVYVRRQIFYLTACITYHIITFDCQEQFIPAVKCIGYHLFPPAVQFLSELPLLDTVYAFSLQLPIFNDPKTYRNSNLESSATHSVFYINYEQLPK